MEPADIKSSIPPEASPADCQTTTRPGGRARVLQMPSRFTSRPAVSSVAGSPPMAGFLSSATHWRRSSASPVQSLECIASTISPVSPMLPPMAGSGLLARGLHKANETAPPVCARQEPRSSSSLFVFARAAAAAILLLGVIVSCRLWREEPSIRYVTAEDVLSQSGGREGLLARLHHTVNARSAADILEDFHKGMAAWCGIGPSLKGWKRQPGGYVQPGELALFRPSVLDRDYTLKFLGQIDRTGLSWAVRAKDRQNYYAIKVTADNSGPRPWLSIEHVTMVQGRARDYSKKPLNIMLPKDRPFRVTVNVKGDRILTSIEDEEVDSFRDDHLHRGAVGFFSEPNERARIYWVELLKNQDLLGRICARLSNFYQSGFTRPETAALENPLADLRIIRLNGTLPGRL